MGVTVRAAMKVGGLRRCRVVAGEAGLDRSILYVTVMEVPDVARWLKGKDFLLTSLYAIKDDAAAQEQLIGQLAAVGSAAIAIKTHGFLTEIPEGILRAARELDFPVIEIDADVSYIDILTPLMSRILDEGSAERESLEPYLKWLTEVALEGQGVSAMLDAIDRIVENPVTLETDLPLEADRPSVFPIPLSVEQRAALRKAKHPLRMTRRKREGGDTPCLVAPLVLRREVRGYLTCWQVGRPLRETDLNVLERALPLLALEVLKLQAEIDVAQKYQSDFLADILLGHPAPAGELAEKSRIFGWNFHRTYQIAVFDVDDFARVTAEFAGDEVRIQEFKRSLLRFVERTARATHAETIVSARSDEIVLLWPLQEAALALAMDAQGHASAVTPAEVDSDHVSACADLSAGADAAASDGFAAWPEEAEVSALAERIKTAVRQEFSGVTLTAGVARPYRGVAGIAAGYQEAVRAIALGRPARGRDSVIRFADLGVYRILSPRSDEREWAAFYAETIGPLRRYDKERGARLVETLAAYFACDYSLAVAADTLYIHVNTLKYRLQRIEELTGCPIGNAEGRLKLHIGLKLDAFSVHADGLSAFS
ncbi:MAG: PucR family transcriptional regulator [Bacilli bacterium]